MRHISFLASLLIVSTRPAQAETDPWQEQLSRIERSVVVLKVDLTRSFDGVFSSSSQATGFVVNAEQGLILTNRHVVSPGPVTAKAIFSNNEAVELQAIYRDPVHDFGLFRFDPEDLISLEPESLELFPEGAEVGTEVRVVGNDAGEKLSIMRGTIARLDRPAPNYGAGYNDFNTFYYQAGSATTGGSSGSPVIDMNGKVVALNAGANRKSAASFYLPLHRIERALDLIERGEPVTRGTLQAVWSAVPYDKLRALGLDGEQEAQLREQWPEKRALLVASEILPYGPADEVLELGDILLEVNEVPIADFAEMEALLDDNVDEVIEMVVLRNGIRTELNLVVDDLHRITPASFMEFGGGILHDLSYQQARNQGVNLGGVYVASTGFIFRRGGIPRHAVITEAGNQYIHNLADFEAVLATLPDGSPLSLRYFHRSNPQQYTEGVIHVDRLWFPSVHCSRQEAEWPCRSLEQPKGQFQPPQLVSQLAPQRERRAKVLSPSLVVVDFDIPYKVAGINGSSYRGTGLVVDAERGLIVVDRDTVPIILGSVEITVGGLVQIPGQVVSLHPRHNLALVQYDPKLTEGLGLKSATLHENPLEVGDKVWVVGLQSDHELVYAETAVKSLDPIILPVNRSPRYRDVNITGVSVEQAPSMIGGVLADRKGRVRAFYGSFSYNTSDGPSARSRGIDARIVRETLEQGIGLEPPLRTLGLELHPIALSDAVQRGLSPQRVAAITNDSTRTRKLLQIVRAQTGHPALKHLQAGDILLNIDGAPISTFDELERALTRENHEVVLLRGRQEITLNVQTAEAHPHTDRVLVWSGAYLHAPHPAARSLASMPPSGIYVSLIWYGSPASRAGLYSVSRIVGVNGVATPNLDAFIAATAQAEDRKGMKLNIEDHYGRSDVITLEPDMTWWPTSELHWVNGLWTRTSLQSNSATP